MTVNIEAVIFAFACEPNRGSEPGVGYEFVSGLAEASQATDISVRVLTRPYSVVAIRDELERNFPNHKVQIQGVWLPRWIIYPKQEFRLRLGYLLWQLVAVISARFSMRSSGPIIAHHVTFATGAIPTFEWMLGPRFLRVFGPVGSSQELNKTAPASWRQQGREAFRDHMFRRNLKGVQVAIFQNHWVERQYAGVGAARTVVEPNIVTRLPQSLIESPREASHLGNKSGAVKIAIVGRLLPLKQVDLAIEALSLLPSTVSLFVIGDGVARGSLERLTQRLGVSSRVLFVGEKTHNETLELIKQCDILVHSSRQEGAGWSVGEAQALGVPPVVFAGSGADTAVEVADLGVIVPYFGSTHESAVSLADGVRLALEATPTPSHRWDGERLPRLLLEWYLAALRSGPNGDANGS